MHPKPISGAIHPRDQDRPGIAWLVPTASERHSSRLVPFQSVTRSRAERWSVPTQGSSPPVVKWAVCISRPTTSQDQRRCDKCKRESHFSPPADLPGMASGAGFEASAKCLRRVNAAVRSGGNAAHALRRNIQSKRAKYDLYDIFQYLILALTIRGRPMAFTTERWFDLTMGE